MRGFRVLLVAAVVGATVAAGVSPAAAVAPVVPPLAVPASVVGSLDSATAAQRAAALGNVVKGGPLAVPASTWGSVAKGGPAVMVGVTGFFIGFEGASAVLSWAGVDDVGLKALFPTVVDPEFIPNGDVGVVMVGWADGTNTVFGLTDAMAATYWGGGWVEGDVTAQVVAAPAYGATSGTVTVELTASGNCAPGASGYENTSSQRSPSGFTAAGFVWTADGAPAGTGVSVGGSGQIGTRCNAPTVVRTGVVAAPSGAVFDHVTVLLNSLDGVVNGTLTWYPEGHPQRPAAVIADPIRAWETRWTCSDSSAFVLRSAEFHETDAALPAVPAATCAVGSPISLEVWEVAPLGGATEVLIKSWTPTQALIDWQNDYPQCTDGSCTLELFRLDPTAPTTRLSCFANPGACLDWFTDPAKADKYECRYAGVVVALDECAPYAPTFNVATGTEVQTSTGPRPAPEIAPYADPATGEPVPATDPLPLPSPAGQPGSQPDGCPPPFEVSIGGLGHWVYKGVACALAWAMVPSLQAVTQGRDAMDQAYLDSAVGDVRGLFVSLSAVHFSGNCGVLYSSPVQAFGGRVMELDTCGPPWTSAGPLRALAGLAFIVGTTVAIVKMVSRALGLKSLGVAGLKSVASDGD